MGQYTIFLPGSPRPLFLSFVFRLPCFSFSSHLHHTHFFPSVVSHIFLHFFTVYNSDVDWSVLYVQFSVSYDRLTSSDSLLIYTATVTTLCYIFLLCWRVRCTEMPCLSKTRDTVNSKTTSIEECLSDLHVNKVAIPLVPRRVERLKEKNSNLTIGKNLHKVLARNDKLLLLLQN